MDVKYIKDKKCFRCGADKAVIVQSEHGKLIHNFNLQPQNVDGFVVGGPNLPCYLKLCMNCGFVEVYSQKLVDSELASSELRQEIAMDLLKKDTSK